MSMQRWEEPGNIIPHQKLIDTKGRECTVAKSIVSSLNYFTNLIGYWIFCFLSVKVEISFASWLATIGLSTRASGILFSLSTLTLPSIENSLIHAAFFVIRRKPLIFARGCFLSLHLKRLSYF